EVVDLGRGANDPKSVAQPLDGGSADEDATLDGVLHRGVAELPGHGGKEPAPASDRIGTGEKEHEAAGAVGALHEAGSGAELAKESGLLVPHSGADRYRFS